MTTRGKRILELLRKEESAIVKVKTKGKFVKEFYFSFVCSLIAIILYRIKYIFLLLLDHTITSKKCNLETETLPGDEIYEYETDEDPWLEFKKWNSRTRNPQVPSYIKLKLKNTVKWGGIDFVG